MIQGEALDLIIGAVGNENISLHTPMSNHTTFKIGGNADIIIEPKSENELVNVVKILKDNSIPYFIMGNGSNLLVGDKGIKGAVIKLSNAMSDYRVEDNKIIAESGIKLSRIASVALSNNLTGFEFASGIPGTLGGAVFMNAGAYGGEMKDIVSEVRYYNADKNKICVISAKECEFGYRKSYFSDKNMIILGATLNLKKGDANKIKEQMNELARRRNEKQPTDKPSAGSTFKRPEGYFAGTMIEECGLKGTRVGGAEVSVKHAGFVINSGDATAKDVCMLIEKIQKTVYDKYGVSLETEVKFVGEF